MTPSSRHRPWPVLLISGALTLSAAGTWLLFGAADQDATPVQAVGGPQPDAGRTPADPEAGSAVDPTSGVDSLEVVVLATLAPPVPPAARLVDRGVAIDQVVELLAGPGTADPASRSGPHLLRFTLADGTRLLRVARLSPTTTVDVPRLAARRLAGRVADADGLPLAGEVVWAGQWWRDGQRSEVVTDAEGRFEFDAVPTGPGVVVIAPGGDRFAPAWRLVDPMPDAPVDELLVTLRRRAELTVNLLAQVGDPRLGRVWLRPADAATATTSFPYFLAGLEGDGGFALDATGEASIPAPGGEARVDVVVGHPDLLLTDRRGVRLGGRVPARARVAADAGAAVAITVRGLDGAPCAGVLVELGPVGGAPVRAPGALLPRAAQTGAWSFGESDDDGRLVLRRPSGQRAQLTVHSGVPSHWLIAEDGAEIEVFAVAREDVEQAVEGEPSLVLANSGATSFDVRSPDGGRQRILEGGLLDIPLERPALIELRRTAAVGSSVVVARVPVLGAQRLVLPD